MEKKKTENASVGRRRGGSRREGQGLDEEKNKEDSVKKTSQP